MATLKPAYPLLLAPAGTMLPCLLQNPDINTGGKAPGGVGFFLIRTRLGKGFPIRLE
eukprot:COSAG01_NODE_3966_length_5488_cov_65.012618_5_plen_57_part_00